MWGYLSLPFPLRLGQETKQNETSNCPKSGDLSPFFLSPLFLSSLPLQIKSKKKVISRVSCGYASACYSKLIYPTCRFWFILLTCRLEAQCNPQFLVAGLGKFVAGWRVSDHVFGGEAADDFLVSPPFFLREGVFLF